MDGGKNTLQAGEVVGRHQTLIAALEGVRPMDWSTWALPIYDAHSLTSRGREAALWATDALRRAFGDAFLRDAWNHHRTHPPVQLWDYAKIHPVFDQGVWPLANYAPWAIANFLQLATQLELMRSISRPVRMSMKDYRDPVKWIHGLLQLEVAGLGLRAGWRTSFEPSLGTGRLADVRFDSLSACVLVETSSLRMSNRELRALGLANELTGRVMFGLRDIAMRHVVYISGEVMDLTPQVETTEWLGGVENAAAATALDGEPRDIPAPSGGVVHISRDATDGQSLTVSCPNPDIPPDPLGRLAYKIREKAEQAAGSSQPVWVRLEEFAGIWRALNQSQLTLSDKLTFLTSVVRWLLAPYPNLAGIIIAPVALWVGNVESIRLQETIIGPDAAAVAVRSSLPPHRVRETVIIARTSTAGIGLEALTRWYEDEAGWLDWALANFDFPPFRELVQESTTAS